MSERCRFVEGHAHFITFAVVGLVNDGSAYQWSSAKPYLDFECDAG